MTNEQVFERKDGMVIIPEELWEQIKANVMSQNADYKHKILMANQELNKIYDDYLLKFDSHETTWYKAVVKTIAILEEK